MINGLYILICAFGENESYKKNKILFCYTQKLVTVLMAKESIWSYTDKWVNIYLIKKLYILVDFVSIAKRSGGCMPATVLHSYICSPGPFTIRLIIASYNKIFLKIKPSETN